MAGLRTQNHIFINKMKGEQTRQKFILATRYQNTYCTLDILHIFVYYARFVRFASDRFLLSTVYQ